MNEANNLNHESELLEAQNSSLASELPERVSDPNVLRPSHAANEGTTVVASEAREEAAPSIPSNVTLRDNQLHIGDPGGVRVVNDSPNKEELYKKSLRGHGLGGLLRGGSTRIGGVVQTEAGRVTYIDTQGDFSLTGEQPIFDDGEENGYIVATLHLAYNNRFEVSTQKRKRRNRVLELMMPALSDELTIELQGLRDSVSSVSVISRGGGKQIHQDTKPGRHCDEHCWLNKDIWNDQEEEMNDYPGIRIKLPKDPYFRYQPLGPRQTRILCLHSRTNAQPIIVSMIPMNENDSGPYEALSYTWGPVENKPSVIILNDRVFMVTDNLYAILRDLSHPTRSRWLWIDAICINQGDNEEKSLQIPMMSSIYRNAERVVVWVGEHENNSELALAGMAYLDVTENRETLFNEDHDEGCMIRLKNLYESLLAFYRRPWFRRTWIRQEIMVAKKVAFIAVSIPFPGTQ